MLDEIVKHMKMDIECMEWNGEDRTAYRDYGGEYLEKIGLRKEGGVVLDATNCVRRAALICSKHGWIPFLYGTKCSFRKDVYPRGVNWAQVKERGFCRHQPFGFDGFSQEKCLCMESRVQDDYFMGPRRKTNIRGCFLCG